MAIVATNNYGIIDGNGNQATFNDPFGIYFDSSSQNLIITSSNGQNISFWFGFDGGFFSNYLKIMRGWDPIKPVALIILIAQ